MREGRRGREVPWTNDARMDSRSCRRWGMMMRELLSQQFDDEGNDAIYVHQLHSNVEEKYIFCTCQAQKENIVNII